MREARHHSHSSSSLLLLPSLFASSAVLPSTLLLLFAGDAHAAPSPPPPPAVALVDRRDGNNPLNIDWSPAPSPEDGPELSANAVRDPVYLPAQIGGIVGSYALSLVLVAALLLLLSRKRREALAAADDEVEERKAEPQPPTFDRPLASPRSVKGHHVRNFSLPSPDQEPHPYVFPSPTSTVGQPGTNPFVDPRVVAADRTMAQSQLEEMYKYVMEQEEAKLNGVVLEGPPRPLASHSTTSLQRPSISSTASSSAGGKKEKTKPAHLNLGGGGEQKEKTHSRASSILSALRSPRKKGLKGMSISSPIMTPMSGTFPPAESREMSAIPPRQYAPPPPPPVPTDQAPYAVGAGAGAGAAAVPRSPGHASLPTPEHSPESTLSIDERIGHQLPPSQQQYQHQYHSRNTSLARTIEEPESASSTAPLVGLPSSPKPYATRFPSSSSLPLSPRQPGAGFSRPHVPTAVRTDGALPLRAYEQPPILSPSGTSHQAAAATKQTVFERMGPLSPMGGARTPATGAAVPYSPYQPFSPCIPITPSLVTREDRKRMKKLEPKTPTMQMVKSSEEIW